VDEAKIRFKMRGKNIGELNMKS